MARHAVCERPSRCGFDSCCRLRLGHMLCRPASMAHFGALDGDEAVPESGHQTNRHLATQTKSSAVLVMPERTVDATEPLLTQGSAESGVRPSDQSAGHRPEARRSTRGARPAPAGSRRGPASSALGGPRAAYRAQSPLRLSVGYRPLNIRIMSGSRKGQVATTESWSATSIRSVRFVDRSAGLSQQSARDLSTVGA